MISSAVFGGSRVCVCAFYSPPPPLHVLSDTGEYSEQGIVDSNNIILKYCIL